MKPDAKSELGRWVMTSAVEKDPWLLTFRIGQVKIAEISFLTNKAVFLRMWEHGEAFDEPKAVSKAMQEMHRRLKSPPQEP